MLACEAATGPKEQEREKLSELITLMVTSGADVNRQNDVSIKGIGNGCFLIYSIYVSKSLSDIDGNGNGDGLF